MSLGRMVPTKIRGLVEVWSVEDRCTHPKNIERSIFRLKNSPKELTGRPRRPISPRGPGKPGGPIGPGWPKNTRQYIFHLPPYEDVPDSPRMDSPGSPLGPWGPDAPVKPMGPWGPSIKIGNRQNKLRHDRLTLYSGWSHLTRQARKATFSPRAS